MLVAGLTAPGGGAHGAAAPTWPGCWSACSPSAPSPRWRSRWRWSARRGSGPSSAPACARVAALLDDPTPGPARCRPRPGGERWPGRSPGGPCARRSRGRWRATCGSPGCRPVPRGAAPALDRIDLDLPAGRRIAVVGPSGAGKSTLAARPVRRGTPDAGRVTLAGATCRRTRPRNCPRAVGGLLAEAYVFHASVRENLLLGRPDAGRGGTAAADAAAGLLDWVREPAGRLGHPGRRGGRSALRRTAAAARARPGAARRPPVLVLDEPTEGLDPVAADTVLARVLAATPAGRSVLLISHRLSGLAGMDEVVVLDAGRIVQRGRHADLVAAPGWYRDQWVLQEAAERGYLALTP